MQVSFLSGSHSKTTFLAFSWEQRKFSDLYEKVSRKNDLTYGKDDIISVANIARKKTKKEFFILSSTAEKKAKKGKRITIRREAPSHEMTVADFDTWKARLTEEALHYRRHDDLTTRKNVSIENLLETDLICDESVEDEFIRAEEEKQLPPKDETAMLELLVRLINSCLSGRIAYAAKRSAAYRKVRPAGSNSVLS